MYFVLVCVLVILFAHNSLYLYKEGFKDSCESINMRMVEAEGEYSCVALEVEDV